MLRRKEKVMSEEDSSSRKGPVVMGSVLVVIFAVFIFICLASVVAIAILALLGPQIGNVFSQINSGLQATPIP